MWMNYVLWWIDFEWRAARAHTHSAWCLQKIQVDCMHKLREGTLRNWSILSANCGKCSNKTQKYSIFIFAMRIICEFSCVKIKVVLVWSTYWVRKTKFVSANFVLSGHNLKKTMTIFKNFISKKCTVNSNDGNILKYKLYNDKYTHAHTDYSCFVHFFVVENNRKLGKIANEKLIISINKFSIEIESERKREGEERNRERGKQKPRIWLQSRLQ